jgi:hypothetical protein
MQRSSREVHGLDGRVDPQWLVDWKARCIYFLAGSMSIAHTDDGFASSPWSECHRGKFCTRPDPAQPPCHRTRLSSVFFSSFYWANDSYNASRPFDVRQGSIRFELFFSRFLLESVPKRHLDGMCDRLQACAGPTRTTTDIHTRFARRIVWDTASFLNSHTPETMSLCRQFSKCFFEAIFMPR